MKFLREETKMTKVNKRNQQIISKKSLYNCQNLWIIILKPLHLLSISPLSGIDVFVRSSVTINLVSFEDTAKMFVDGAICSRNHRERNS